MKRARHQELLTELKKRRKRAAPPLLQEPVHPIETVSGAVPSGPALLVQNTSAAHLSTGIEVQVGAEDAAGDVLGRIFGLSATVDQYDGVGVIGRGDYGVVGQSEENVGVMGFGTTGLYGFSNDPNGCGVEGQTTSPSGIGVLATTSKPEITALAIDTGNIRVLGAGENTPTPVFVHVASEQNTRGSQTAIDHPMTNGDPRAILIVTRREALFFTQGDATSPAPGSAPCSVAYSARAGTWLIVQRDGTALPPGTAFNVLVFKA
jgi:hypothetical protein